MDHPQQIIAFTTELENIVERYIEECDMPAASIIGSLELMKFKLMQDAFRQDEDPPPWVDPTYPTS